MSVIIETTVGDITVDLFVDERPRACLNFLKLCKVKYYNYCLIHSVQRNFVAQTGDPTGTGRGGESVFRMIYGDQAKFFDAEKVPKLKHHSAGLISMVNDGNDRHGSQFLFTLGENLDSLDAVHTVFGEVAEGMDALMKINETFCDKDHRPYQDIRITHTVIIDDPLDDPSGLEVPDKSPDPTQEQLDGCFRIGADEVINDDEGLEEEEIQEREQKKDATHSAQVLEIIGDIPDKDVKPPDNVLFVCKLNSITTDDDLEIIFSRFGNILSCEIIRDYKTGDSLQYAFIEFETPEECEQAYKKMDNVLIDDRRIHVDFSQSVSKLQFPKFKATKETIRKSPMPTASPVPVRRHRDDVPSRNFDESEEKRNRRTDNDASHRGRMRGHHDDVSSERRTNRRNTPPRMDSSRRRDDVTRSRHSDSHKIPPRNRTGDVTPPRHGHKHNRYESSRKNDHRHHSPSPEKRHNDVRNKTHKRHDSSSPEPHPSDVIHRTKQRHQSSSPENSRKGQRRNADDAPRKSKKRDVTPLRQSRHVDSSPERHQPYVTPPSKIKKRHESSSPERRHQNHKRRRHGGDLSPHKSKKRHEFSSPELRRRDVTPPKKSKKRDGTPTRKVKKRQSSLSPENTRHRDVDVTSATHRTKYSDDSSDISEAEVKVEKSRKNKENGKMRSKKEKKQKKKKRRSSTSDESDSDISSSVEPEVRCGKHRKRSVSNHKDEVRRKSHKHRH